MKYIQQRKDGFYLKGVYMPDKQDFAPVEGSAGKTYLNKHKPHYLLYHYLLCNFQRVTRCSIKFSRILRRPIIVEKALSFLLTVIFVMSLSTLVYANEEKSTEQVPSSEYSNEIKSAEKVFMIFLRQLTKKIMTL
nr:hypothetical protein [Desulforamulus aquiferis]